MGHQADWKLDNGVIIRLLKPETIENLPDGMTLINIFGKKAVTGRDKIDMDTRFGYTAWGYPVGNKGD